VISVRNKELTRIQIRWVRRVGDHNHVSSNQKLLHWQSSVHQWTVMVNKLVLALPLFPRFLADLLPQMFLNLPIAMLVNHLAWRTKSWRTMPSRLKINTNVLLMFHLTCLLQICRGWSFLLRGLPFGFLVITVNPGFVSCISYAVILSLKQNFMQCVVPAYQPLENHRSHWTQTTTNTGWEPMLKVIAAKLTTLTQQTVIIRHLVAKSCSICCSVLVARLRTSRHAFVYFFTKLVSLHGLPKLENVPTKHTFYNMG
jgi:hypothetical protein